MSYRPQADDTMHDGERIQFGIYARMTGAEKIEQVRALCKMANRLALEVLRRRHPHETEPALRWRLVTMRFGEYLASRIILLQLRPPALPHGRRSS